MNNLAEKLNFQAVAKQRNAYSDNISLRLNAENSYRIELILSKIETNRNRLINDLLNDALSRIDFNFFE